MSDSDSSSDDGIFTELVDLNKKPATRRTPTSTASPARSARGTAAKARQTTQQHRQQQQQQTQSQSHHHSPARPTDSAGPSSSSLAAGTGGDGGSPVISTEGNNSSSSNTTAELSVMALQAMSSAAAAAPPATPRSASINTECSSSPNEQTGEGKHKKERRRRRLVGGTRPPLHRSTLTAAVASAAAADVELEDGGAGVLSRAHTTVSSAASAGGAAVEDADFRGTPERVRRYSSSTGDLITGSSLASAANDATTTNTATSRRASSPHTKPASGRARRYLPRGAGSPPMPDGSPPSSSLAAPVAAHMLSDEAYLDTFKIPALIAQLSLSLMAAKPMDLRAFTRDWLADRLVSEEDEDDDAGGAGGTLEEGTLGRTPSAIAVPTAAGAGGAGRPSSYERGSNPSCNMAGSSSMSDAMSNHSSSKNVDSASAAPMMASAAAASTSQRTSNSTSLRSSTRGARGGGMMPSRGSSLAEVGGQGELDGDTNTNDDDDTAGVEDDSRRSQDDRQRTTTTISTSVDLEDSPPELLITTSEKPTLLDTAAAVASASDPRRAAERKNIVRRTSAAATAERGGDKRVRKSRSGSGSGGARNTAAVRRTPQKRRAAAQRGARALRTSTTESHSTNSSPAHTPSKATKEPSVVHGHGDFSSPNTSILNTLSPQEASTMNEEERKERAKMLADMAEAAFLHEVEEKRRKGARRGEQQSKKAAAAADDGDGDDDGSAASSSSSSSSASFFDSPATEVGGWSRVALTPSSSLSHKDGAAGAENSEEAQAQNAYSLPLPVPEDEAVDTGDGNMPNVSSLTEVGRSGADEHESHAGRSKLDETVSAMEVFSSPLYRQQTWNPSSSSTTVASSSAVAAAAAIGAVARASATSAMSIPSTFSPDREGVKSSGQRRENERDGPTPPSSKFQSPHSTTAEHSRTASSDVEHLAAAPPTTGANTAAAVARDADEQEKQKSSSSTSSSSDDAGDDNTSFAMFAPLLAVDKHTNEVIDYRTSVGSASGQPTYPGAPPLNIPSGGITRMATPPLPGAPPSHLVNSLSGGANGTQSAASGPGTSASLSGVSGSSAALAQTHTSTAVSQPPQFPPYAPRLTTGAFNFLPTPMLADMVGGGGLTNSSFGRRAVQNSSFGRRSGAATAALAALARQGEYAVTPTNASLAPPPFLTPHEPGSIGMTSNWRSAPNLQLAGFPKIGSGANTVSNLGGGGGGLSVSEGVLEARPRMAASSPPGPTATTPHTIKVSAEELPAEPPTAYSQVALSQGKASDGAEQRTDANNHATNADLSDAETTTSLQPDGNVHVSPLSATLKADSARRLGKLMDQLPPNKYAAAIVFLEGLMSSSANSDGVDASGSDVMSITTTAGGAASSRNLGRFTMSEQTLVEPSSLSRGGLGKPVSPVVNSNSEAIISAHAWPLPTRGESSPLGGVPIHGVSSFSERLTSSPALGGGVGDGVVGVVDVLHGADAADGMTKTAGTAAAAAAGGGGTAAMTTAAQTTGSASLEAIVRDALSQSILRTLPQTHSGADGTASSTKHLAAQTTTTHAATTTNIMGDFAGGGARAKEYPPVKTVNLSSVRLDPSGEWAERRQDHAMPSSVVAAALAQASASVSAAAASGPVGAEPPASSVGAFSIRSNASAPLAGAGAVQLGLAPSFYKRPSGNDLSSLCPNPSSEEITVGSPLGPNLAGTRHATVSDSYDSRTSTANHQAGAVSVREAGDSAPRRADLVAVSAAFASALTSPESQDTPVARHTSTMPPSPALLAAEPTHSDHEAPATTASDTPERMSGDAPAVPCTEENVPEQGSHEAAQDSGVEQPAAAEAIAVPLRAEAREEPYSPFVSTHNSARASFAALPSLIGVGAEGAAPTTAAATAAAAPVNPSSTGSSVTGTAASPPSHDSSDHPEGSTTLPAGAEGPHHTTQTEEEAPVTDANNTTATISTTVADENESTVKAGVSHRNSLSTPLQAPRQGTQTPSLESKTDKVHSTASTEPPLHSDGSQHPATHLDVAHGAEVGESNSSIEPPLRGSPRRQRRGHPKVDSARANESSGSWLEGMALSGLGEISPRPTRHRSRWRSGPGFLFDGDNASTPQGTSTGTTFTSSPPPPPLPESVLAAGKEGGALSGGAAGHELLLDAVNHYEDDIDLGATLRTAVVMAAAAGSHVAHCANTSVAGSPFNTFTTQSSSLLPESISSSAFSPRGRFDAFRGDLAASSSHFDSPAPQSAAGAVIAAAATAPPLYLQQQQQQAHAQAGTAGRPSDLSSRTISPPGTHNNSMVADGNSGSGGTSLSMMATLGAGSTAPGTTYVSPTTQLPPSLTNTPTHAGGMTTSSVAAAMNSFLSREEQVAPEEVDVVREAVARFDAFAALDETQLETLVRTMARVELSAGQTLVQEGEATLEKLLLVVSGKLSIARKGVVTRSFTRGQFYGEVEMSYHVERSRVTLTAVAPTVVYALTKMDYQKLVIHEKDARRYMFLQYVNQCELFKGLSPPTKMRLADSFRVCRLRKGAKLTEQGAPVQWMYLLMSGTVRMTCKPAPPVAFTPLTTPTTTTVPGWERQGLSRKATTAESDMAAAAAAAAGAVAAPATPHAIVELLNAGGGGGAAANAHDAAAMASISSTAQGPNSSLRCISAGSPPFTPFHRPSALTQTPEGKPGSGVPELLQLAESKVHSVEMRKSSSSICATPLHPPGSQHGGGPQRHSSLSRDENNSSSASRRPHPHTSGSGGGGGHDGAEEVQVPTSLLGKTTPSLRSEDHGLVTTTTKDKGTPELRRRRDPRRHHIDPNAQHTPVSPSTAGPRLSSAKFAVASLNSTAASLDPSALLRCTSPSPSTASGNAKRSMSSINVVGSPRVTKAMNSGGAAAAAAAMSSAFDGSVRLEDSVVVVDRSRGQPVGEPEFVFKCKGLFTAVATAPVQAARISRLHFEAIMTRSVIEELKRNMLLNPDYYYFESTVPEELKQEMRRMLFRLNVGSSARRRPQFALPVQRHRESHRGGSWEKSESRSGLWAGAGGGGGGGGGGYGSGSADPEQAKHTWSRQLSTSASPMLVSQLLKKYTSVDSVALPSSPTGKSQGKRRFRTIRVQREAGATDSSNPGEEVESVRSGNGTRHGSGTGGSSGQRGRRHRTAPLEASPAPDSDSRDQRACSEASAAATGTRTDATAVPDAGDNSHTTTSSARFLEAPSVSNHAARGSSSSLAEISPTTTGDDRSHLHGVGNSGGSGTGKNAGGRSRAGQRRETADNLTFSAKHSSTAGSRSRRISARGEIVFSGSRNLYRFTADAMSLNQSIVIAVVVDGTIIRWNSVAQSVTGYAPYETIGKSIYEFIASEEGRQQMRDVLALGMHYAGRWEQYTEQRLQDNRVFPFRQNTGLYQVGLALSVVPSNNVKTAEVLLLVGREGKYRAANTYASDVARWLEGLLKPQLRQFQRRMMQIESHGWRVTSEDALQVKGNLDACLSMVEQFTKFSLLNMEAVNESWRPVRLPALLSRFAVEASAFARQRGHEYYCNIEQVEPKSDIFFDAPQMLAILRLLLTDALLSPNIDEDGNPIVVHAELRVTVVEPQDTHPGPASAGGGAFGTGSPSRMAPCGAAATTSASFAATGTAAAAAAGTKLNVIPPHAATVNVLPGVEQINIHPLPHSLSFPYLQPTEELHRHGSGHLHTNNSAVLHAASDDASLAGANSTTVDTPNTSAGNTGAVGTPPSVNAAGSARLAMSGIASNAAVNRAATTGCVTVANAASPTTTTLPSSLSASLRRIRFELRDDGPTIMSLRSPEAVATASMRAAGLADGASCPPTAPASPDAASLQGESPVNAVSGAGLAGDGAASPVSATPAVRGAALPQVEKILSSLGGTMYGFTRPEAAGNVVRVELPLLAVPGAGEDGRDDENGLANGGTGAPFAGGSRTFTVIVADNNRAHQQLMCQILWARQHAVVPVTSFRELVRKLEMNTADILLIDPLQIDVSSEDYEILQGDDPFDEIRNLSARLALVVMTSDFSDWRVQKLLNRHAVVELPKVGSGALVHIAMQEAEQLVAEMRDEEERIDLIRRTFTNCSAERHKVGKRIGKGAFGDVYEVEDTLTGGKMAMKRMRLHDGLLADEVVQEILAMTTLKHENIIQYFYCEKESDTLLRLYMELAPGGTLRDKIRENPGVSLSFEDIVHHLSDICHGLAYVHEQSYVHGDLKTANLLLGTRGRTKIGDFGTAKHLAPHQLLYTMVGTPQYMAPEVLTADIEERLGYNFKADIWSLGCIVLEMATGSAPFAHLECAQGMGIIKYLTELTDTPDLSPLFSANPLVYEFVKSCLDIDPRNRPTAQELLHFDILEGAVASQRAERLVKRAEMLYKLNKYAAMRADGGGGPAMAGDGTNSVDSMNGDQHDPGESGMFYSRDGSTVTEDYSDYYGDNDDEESELIDDVSASDEEDEEGEYVDEEYSSEEGSRSRSGESGPHEAAFDGSGCRDAATVAAATTGKRFSLTDAFQSQTTHAWTSAQEQLTSPGDIVRSASQLLSREQPVQSPLSSPTDDAAAVQRFNAVLQASTPSSTSTPKVTPPTTKSDGPAS